ncbi:MAG: hypothetical protein V7754_14980 [Halioglobus sp.]
MYRTVFSLLAAFLFTACSSSGSAPTQQPDPLSQSSAVSVAMPEFVTSADTTLRWRSDVVWVDDPEGKYERRADLLQQILKSEFELKGYQFVGPEDDATYDVLAVAVLGDLQDQEEIEKTFRLYPSLASNPSGYTKGNLLVAIAPAGTDLIVWRGAIEVFSDPGMQPLTVRQQRMEWAAQQLLSSIPNY